MSEHPAADRSASAPERAQAPTEPRAADIMYGAPPPPTRRVIATARQAEPQRDADVMFEPSAPVQRDQPESAGRPLIPAEPTHGGDGADEASSPPNASGDHAEPEAVIELTQDVDVALPAGFEVDQPVVNDFADIVAATGMEAAEAQRLVDLHVEQVRRTVEGHHEALVKAWGEREQGWREQIANDPHIKAAGRNNVRAACKQTITDFGVVGSDFRAAMTELGGGNHPAVVKFLWSVQATLEHYNGEIEKAQLGWQDAEARLIQTRGFHAADDMERRRAELLKRGPRKERPWR